MNDFDLDAQLKALRPPERDEDYWADFPGRVSRELRRPPVRPLRSSWLPQLACGFCLAFVCFALGYYLGHDKISRQISNVWREDQQELARFNAQIASFDEHGLRKMLADQP